MAVDELATKALESDAADTSLIAGDTPAQTGPTMGVGHKFRLILGGNEGSSD